jgi:hypothetical protein
MLEVLPVQQTYVLISASCYVLSYKTKVYVVN